MLKNARFLAGLSIYLRDDYCKETLQKQAELRPILALARAEDRQAKLVGDKIVFQGNLYGKSDLHIIPLDTEKSFCRRGSNVTVFKGELCPLSNLYSINLSIDGKDYASNEHWYQYKKLLAHGKRDLAYKARLASTAREAMNIGKAVRPSREWVCSEGTEIMKKGVSTKFDQEDMKDYLLSTTGIIGEATMNWVWGIGLDIRDDSAMRINQWQGSNIMGDILTEYRDTLLAHLQ
jgi:hypothetical protein